MATSGLTRRRGVGIAADENGDRSGSPAGPSVQGGNSSYDGRGGYTIRRHNYKFIPEKLMGLDYHSEVSYTSEDGHKIAYDPRDISESKERNKQPKLTLMEEVLLLGLKDKQACRNLVWMDIIVTDWDWGWFGL